MNKLKYPALILLTLLLVGGCFLQNYYITNLTDDLFSHMETFSRAIDRDDFNTAQAALSRFSAIWSSHRQRLYALTDHTYVSDIDAELAALSADLRNQNATQLYSETARLTEALNTLVRPDQFSLSNIF